MHQGTILFVKILSTLNIYVVILSELGHHFVEICEKSYNNLKLLHCRLFL